MTEYHKVQDILNNAASHQVWATDILADAGAYILRAYNKYHSRRPNKKITPAGNRTSDLREALMVKFENDVNFVNDGFWTHGETDVNSSCYPYFQHPERVLSSKNGANLRSFYVKVPKSNPLTGSQGGVNPVGGVPPIQETSTPKQVEHVFKSQDSQNPSDIINNLNDNIKLPENPEIPELPPPPKKKPVAPEPTRDDLEGSDTSQLANVAAQIQMMNSQFEKLNKNFEVTNSNIATLNTTSATHARELKTANELIAKNHKKFEEKMESQKNEFATMWRQVRQTTQQFDDFKKSQTDKTKNLNDLVEGFENRIVELENAEHQPAAIPAADIKKAVEEFLEKRIENGSLPFPTQSAPVALNERDIAAEFKLYLSNIKRYSNEFKDLKRRGCLVITILKTEVDDGIIDRWVEQKPQINFKNLAKELNDNFLVRGTPIVLTVGSGYASRKIVKVKIELEFDRRSIGRRENDRWNRSHRILTERKRHKGLLVINPGLPETADEVYSILYMWKAAGIIIRYDVTHYGEIFMIINDGDADKFEEYENAPLNSEEYRDAKEAYEETCNKLWLKDPHLILKMRGVDTDYLGKLANKSSFVGSDGNLLAIPDRWARNNDKNKSD